MRITHINLTVENVKERCIGKYKLTLQLVLILSIINIILKHRGNPCGKLHTRNIILKAGSHSTAHPVTFLVSLITSGITGHNLIHALPVCIVAVILQLITNLGNKHYSNG